MVAAGLAVSLVPVADQGRHRARPQRRRARRCATRARRRVVASTAAGGRPTQATRRDGRVAGARRGSRSAGPPSSLPGHGGGADRRQGDRPGRARGGQARRRRVGRAGPRAARARHRAGRRRPRLGGLRRRQAEGVGRGRHPGLRPPAARRTPRTTRSTRSCATSPPTRACRGSCSSSRRRRRSTAPRLAAMIPPGKDVDGLTPVSAGLLAQGRPGLRPCTPSGIMELLRRHDVDARGRRGGRGRPLRPRRPPDLRAAAGRQRHRHRLPLAHPRPRRGLPPRRRARRRRRAPAA